MASGYYPSTGRVMPQKTECARVVVTELRDRFSDNPQTIYHLPEQRTEAWWAEVADWVPIRCGQGISYPYRSTVPASQVCPDCLALPATPTDSDKEASQ